MKPLANRIALITGGSKGIGRAAAVRFAERGADVVIADVDTQAAELTVAEITKMDRKAIFVKTDVSIQEEVEAMVRKTIDTYGRLDFAFNNAGIEGEQARTAECSAENWKKVIDINLTGLWYCMRAELNEMIKAKRGAIVNMSSVAGRVGFLNIPAYTASKHGVIGLTKTAALEYAEMNIRVNAVCPGVIYTAMIDRFTGGDEAALQGMAEMQPIGRMGKPEEVADLVVYLCSSDAAFITGESVAVDGGFTAR